MYQIIISTLLVQQALSQSCSTGAIYSQTFDRCYQYFSTPVEYQVAEQQCSDLGGHLASIQNREENALIQSNAAVLFKRSNYSDFWIGANDFEGSWKWTDGSPFNYNNWYDGRPESGSDCAVDNKNDGTWVAIACTANRPFVCVIPPIITSNCSPTTPMPSTCPPSTPCPNNTCAPSCDQAWTYHNGFCYKVYHNAKWADAEESCVVLGAHLVSIHSHSENQFVNDLASCGIKEGNPKNLAWIGMSKRGWDWEWTDGTRTDFFWWADKQPDHPNKELCVQTAPDESYHGWYHEWNNIECDTVMRAYICKKEPYYK